MSKNKQHFISVIVPVYKQAKTIRQDIYTIYDTLERIRYNYEIIVVVDGIHVDSSYDEVKKLKLKNLKTIGYEHNHGKGYAIRFAMARAKGDYIAFIDAGMEIDPNGLSLIVEQLEWYQADIIVGSKRHPASFVNYPLDRKIISFGAQIISRILLNINIRDTQAGLKIFRRKVLETVLPRLLIKNYAFDLELLSVSNRLGFTRIYEAPIKLTYDFTSLTHATGLKIIFNCLWDALAVFYRLRIKKYYDNQNKRGWIYDPELDMRINTGK
ncbi:MAG: glycosyltransferase [Candidatus Shapirobacteria bacterium]